MEMKSEDRAQMESIKELLEMLADTLGDEEKMGEVEPAVIEADVDVIDGDDMDALEDEAVAIEPELEDAPHDIGEDDDEEEIDLKKLFRL